MYLKFGVPVTLSTDDEGVSRGDIVEEYTRAAEKYHLKYLDLKELARASLEYSFLPSESLWKDSKPGIRAAACAADKPSAAQNSPHCARLLQESEKAREEYILRT